MYVGYESFRLSSRENSQDIYCLVFPSRFSYPVRSVWFQLTIPSTFQPGLNLAYFVIRIFVSFVRVTDLIADLAHNTVSVVKELEKLENKRLHKLH